MDPLRNIPHHSELAGQLLRLSTTDRGSFSKLTSVTSVQDWTRAKADEYRQFTLALLTIHNLAAPIHCLPTEVLERIFAYGWHDRKSLRLTHVCRLWRSVILGRAAFWADAVANCGPLFDKKEAMYDELPFVDVLLSRSAHHSHGITPFFHGFSPNIVKALTPYANNVMSLRVALNSQSDFYNGLWPILCSGMQKLGVLHIELKKRVADDRDKDYDDDTELMLGDYLKWELDEEIMWGPRAVLSRKNLPQLTRLTCPPGLVKLFGGVPLRHMKIVGGYGSNNFDDDDAPRQYLRFYRDSLETLEVVGEITWDAERPPEAEPLQIPSLSSLHIQSKDQIVVFAILSWLAFPRSIRFHFTHDEMMPYHHGPDFERFFSSECTEVVRSLITTIDRVYIHCPPSRLFLGGDHITCFTGDVERLRMANYHITPTALVNVFGPSVSVTHFTLSLTASDDLVVDFRAFPHLAHLEMAGPELDSMARMLGPDKPPRGRAAPPPTLCPSLAEVAITFTPAIYATPTPRALLKIVSKVRTMPPYRAEGDADVDKVFSQKCTVLQQVLACRTASGATRLTSLVLCVHPATILSHPVKSAGEWSAELDPIWPSPAARQSVLASLQELVDGPVILKLLDRAGAEVSVEEDKV